MRKKANFFLRLLISAIIILILFYKIGFKDIFQTFLKVNLLYIPLVIIIVISSFLIAALNLKILIDCIDRIRFLKILKYSLLSWAIGLFVPGKLGEFSIIYFLKKENISIGQGLAISIIDKLITALTLSLLTILCFLVFFTRIQTIKLVITLTIIFIVFTFFIMANRGRGFIKKYILRKYAEKFAGFSKTLFYYMKDKKSIVALNFILTFLKWIISSLAISALFLAFNTTIRFYYIVLVTSATIIVGLVPFTISGLGLKESIAVLFYSLIKIEPAVVVSVYLIFTILNYLFATVIFLATETRKFH